MTAVKPVCVEIAEEQLRSLVNVLSANACNEKCLQLYTNVVDRIAGNPTNKAKLVHFLEECASAVSANVQLELESLKNCLGTAASISSPQLRMSKVHDVILLRVLNVLHMLYEGETESDISLSSWQGNGLSPTIPWEGNEKKKKAERCRGRRD